MTKRPEDTPLSVVAKLGDDVGWLSVWSEEVSLSSPETGDDRMFPDEDPTDRGLAASDALAGAAVPIRLQVFALR